MGSGFCVSSRPKRFLIVRRWREYLSSGEKRAGCADKVGRPSSVRFCKKAQTAELHSLFPHAITNLQRVNTIAVFVNCVHEIHFE